ncbi:hypothetical protein SPRG_20940 [Saprolegnia parasitica CBS 223.65]|uniref:Globin domain-containing protein n=1 Tax=Saprolegnia parasitica (strain CBS 223.65) TaxID=695850 RepID=A0A067C9T7_SAPPC|nr:hypothetical protein SPRG_20940 [Saprolegnia parasitica CBS 223.65]KDO23577.1 hypothetical protein SPRG_20940 [Saprolegnia parasitica CBS 223.65]|eukprot:XP_012205764.1 hypothetical protein SPRG_20940 [Saprolegnia parasitica CBS 223.65]
MGVKYSVQAIKQTKDGMIILGVRYKRYFEERCPDFAMVHPRISKDVQALVLANWAAISSGSTPALLKVKPASPVVYFYDYFYGMIFEKAPAVKPLFRSSIIVQGKALINIIQSITSAVNAPNVIEKVCDLAYRHNKYGVKIEYFNLLGKCLLLAMHDCTGDTFTDELREAWRAAYAYMVMVMTPILYHGIVHPTDEDKALSRQGRVQQSIFTSLSYWRHRTVAVGPDASLMCPASPGMDSILPDANAPQCPYQR